MKSNSVCACAYVCMCMHGKRLNSAENTAGKEGQNTAREIHRLHTPLASISLSAHQTFPPYSLALLCNLIYPFLFQVFSIVSIFDSYTPKSSHNPFCPTWSISLLVNTALTNPFQILSHTTSPHLTAHLCHSPHLLFSHHVLMLVSLSKS